VFKPAPLHRSGLAGTLSLPMAIVFAVMVRWERNPGPAGHGI